MPTLIAGAVAIFVLYLLLQMFRAANPAVLARAIRTTGGILALAVAAFTLVKGEVFVALPVGVLGAWLLGWSRFSNFREMFKSWAEERRRGPKSLVRSRFLEMRLYHQSGEIWGQVLAGPNAGRSLDEFDLAQLTAMIPAFDAESGALLESYLD